MNQSQPKTVILVASSFEARQALAYQQQHPRESVEFISADISSILFFNRRHVAHTPIFKFLALSKNDRRLYLAPYQLAQAYLSHPRIKSQLNLDGLDLTVPLVEMVKFGLVFSLEKHYLLHRVYRQLAFQKIVASQQFIPPQILKLFAQEHHLKQASLPVTRLGNLWLNFFNRFKVNLTVLRHFRLALLSLFQPLPQASHIPDDSASKSVLVFSSGLNLATYHSAVKALNHHLPVNVVTGKQSLLDRFFLHQYQLQVFELDRHQFQSRQKIQALSTKVTRLLRRIDLSAPEDLKVIPSFFPIKKSIVSHLLQDDTYFCLKNWMSNFFSYYVLAQQLVEQLKPRLVITTHDPGPSGVAFTIAAQERNIPSAVLLHGSPSEIHFFFADQQIIWGPLMKRWLGQHGGQLKRFTLGGCPIYYDHEKFFRSHLPDKRQQGVIGVLTSGFGVNEINQVEFFLKLFPQLAKIKPKNQIIIRSHFTQKLYGLNQLARQYNLKVIINPPLLLEEFVAKCHLIITQDSTAALVPLIAQKPTIALPTWMPFTDRGFVLNSDAFLKPSPNKPVSQLINSILQDKTLVKTNRQQQRRFLRQYCGPIDAHIGQRIAKGLLKLIQ